LNLQIDDLLGIHKKLIMDPVHGGIPLLSHEVAIIDHPLFQRLRYICQNDILSLVFPGATHSRFLHSIGVMHVGGRMFRAMVENSLKYRTELKHQLSIETLNAISFFNQLVRCACLLHDVGHSSFSHQFNHTPTIKAALAKPGRFEQLWQGIDFSGYYQDIPTQLEHEHFSVRAAWEILHDIRQSELPLPAGDILSLMDTVTIAPSELFKRHADHLWLLIQPRDYQVHAAPPEDLAEKLQLVLASIVSGELDADRADYMLRDGFHSSVTIGGFNLDHLLSNLHFGWCSQTQWFGLAIAEKSLSSLEDFVYSRHQMYRQVYAHKTAQGFDWLLRAAIDEVMQQPEIYDFVDLCLSDIKQFKHLTDSYFWEAFRQLAVRQPSSYAHCILERIKMKHIATRENLSILEEKHYRAFLAQEQPCPPEHVIASSITARFTKIKEDYQKMKVRITNHQNPVPFFKSISQSSQFFNKFVDEKITHFYLDPLTLTANQ
jgi:HD superfamily phosphohydrolase